MILRSPGLLFVGLLLWAGWSPKAAPAPGDMRREVPAGPPDLVVVAIGDRARRLSLAPSQVSVSAVEAVDWPGSSLVCPQPGM